MMVLSLSAVFDPRSFDSSRPLRTDRDARAGSSEFRSQSSVDARRENAGGTDADHDGESRPYEYHNARDLSLSIGKQETLVAALQGKIAAIMSELTAVMSASMIEELVAQQGVEQGNIAAILAREGAMLSSLPGSPVPFLVTSLRARRGDLMQAMAQLSQLRSQIAQAESRLSVAVSRSGSRFTLG